MPRFRYDKDLDCVIEIREGDNYFVERPQGPYIISDIQPYRTVAGDVACEGKRPVIGGRRQHREFLRRNGLVEVGNDYNKKQVLEGQPRQSRVRLTKQDRVNDIKRAVEWVRNGEQGRADYEP